MSPLDYYVVRSSSHALYSFELVVVAMVWVLVLALWFRGGDRRPLWAYLAGGLYNTGVEVLAQTSGVRTMPDVLLFGTLPVGFPVLPFILGFFEGGVLLLAGFEVVRGLLERERRSLRVGAAIVVGVLALVIVGVVAMRARAAGHGAVVEVTARALFSSGSLLILSVCYAVGIGFALLDVRGDGHDRRGLLLWYVVVASIAAAWYTPAFVAGTRGIARLQDGAYVPPGTIEQVAVLYGYSIVFEAAGFYLPVYVLLRLCRLV